MQDFDELNAYTAELLKVIMTFRDNCVEAHREDPKENSIRDREKLSQLLLQRLRYENLLPK